MKQESALSEDSGFLREQMEALLQASDELLEIQVNLCLSHHLLCVCFFLELLIFSAGNREIQREDSKVGTGEQIPGRRTRHTGNAD